MAIPGTMTVDLNAVFLAALVLAIAAVVVGLWLTATRQPPGAAVSLAPSPSASHSPSPTSEPPATDLAAANTFAHALFAAHTTADLRVVLVQHLPGLLGTRRLWVTGHAGGERQIIVGEDQGARRERILDPDLQEWTTSPLRAGPEVVGLMGVDSTVARSPRTRRIIEHITPFIGQALQNAHRVDTLREASLMDPLTGTTTRREGLARLQAELKRAQRTGASMAVLMLDLDLFKSVNDRWGHVTGDAVLAAVGQTLQRTLRASDIRCRWGGEEFLIVLPETDMPRAQVVATGLLRNIATVSVPTAEGPVGITTSIGLTISPPGELEVEPIIRRADRALYDAKHAGRNRVCVHLRDGAPPAVAAASGAPPAAPEPRETTLPFPDRRNPDRPDRRRVPGPGRRLTDPR